jgi:hypothetical protein
VSTTETDTLTATTGGVTKTFAMQLTGGSPQLTLSSTDLSFGDVTVNTSTTQTVTLTSSGTAALTLNSATLSGTGFTMTGGSFPATLNPGQTVTLTVQFDPTSAAAASGSITVSSNAGAPAW